MDLAWLTMWAVAPVVIVGMIISILTRRRAERSTLSRIEEWGIGLTGTGALLTLGGGILNLIASTSVFSSDPTIVRGFPLTNAELPAFTQKAPAIADAGYDTVWLSVSGVPLDARWLIYGESALPALAMIAISAAVFWLSILLLRGRPFVRSLTNVIGAAAIAVMVSGVGAQVLASAARSAVVDYLDPRVITGGGNMADPSYEGLSGWTLNLDLAPIGWALGLALVATVLEVGQRLQRETEGLV